MPDSTQVFQVNMLTSLPSSFVGIDIINWLNTPGAGFWNDTIGGALTLEKFIGAGISGVSNISISASEWVAVGGQSQLNYQVTTVSDPVTAAQVGDAIRFAIGVILMAVGAAIALIGPAGIIFDIIGLILIAVGALTLIGLTVTEITTALGPVGTDLLIGGGILVLGIVALVAYSFISKR